MRFLDFGVLARVPLSGLVSLDPVDDPVEDLATRLKPWRSKVRVDRGLVDEGDPSSSGRPSTSPAKKPIDVAAADAEAASPVLSCYGCSGRRRFRVTAHSPPTTSPPHMSAIIAIMMMTKEPSIIRRPPPSLRGSDVAASASFGEWGSVHEPVGAHDPGEEMDPGSGIRGGLGLEQGS
jgi:hypothetical protein